MARPMNMAADALDRVLASQPAAFSWNVLASGAPAKPEDLRQLVSVWPVLDYNSLEPGRAATGAVRQAAADASLDSAFMANVRITGSVPIEDDEFATLREGAELNGVISGLIVLVILWLALRSIKLVAAAAVTVAIGLAVTAALGLWLAGPLNPISVAFAVLFVGLGADFAIQFNVRYRAERHEGKSQREALIEGAKFVAAPLTLAAAAAAAGFFSFLPTPYTGLAELGLIAGCGMIVAYLASMTLLPALLGAWRLPPEPKPLGYAGLAPVDRFLRRYRFAVVACTSIVVLAGLPALVHLQFDFNPSSLRNPNTEAVATLNSLRGDPRIEVSSADVLAAPAEVQSLSKKLSALPEVARVRSVESFIPDDQDRKLALVKTAAAALNPALNARAVRAPTDPENVAALKQTVTRLRTAAGDGSSPGPRAAVRLAGDLTKLADGSPAQRQAAQEVFVRPLKMDLDGLRQALNPERVTRDNLPADLLRDWVTPDGRERVEIAPKEDINNDSEALSRFAHAVLSAAPDATGEAISTYEWGRTILAAFASAGAWALCSIALLLVIVLRRVWDVLLTLIPLLVAAAVTLEICALTRFPLNYANIIALPLLLGIGVAFKIYYVTAWRRGEANFLQSPLTRAVFFSALMTATAFGSLWFSSFPGLSSMGKLLALSLACTLASAAVFLPALMGPPRQRKEARENQEVARVEPTALRRAAQ
jgi:hopanoid biosynthesis associated RND transporter like protein HpnN